MYELPASATESVRRAAAGARGNGGFGGLDIASWVEHPHVSDAGADDRVSADLDVVNAANGLLGLLQSLGRNTPTLQGDEAVGVRILRRALEEPMRQIAENGGFEGSVIVEDCRRAQKAQKRFGDEELICLGSARVHRLLRTGGHCIQQS